MKQFMLGVMLLLVIPAHFAQSELSDSELQKIREVIRVEIKTEIGASENRLRAEMKAEIANSEKKLKQYFDAKFEATDAKFEATDAKIDALATRINDLAGYLNTTNMLFGGMVALIVAGIGIPQIIMAFKARGQTGTRTDRQAPRDELAPTPQQYAELQKEQAKTREILQQLREEIEILKQNR